MTTIKRLTPKITDPALLAEISRRGIRREVSAQYFKQAYILPNGVNALSFGNDQGGQWCYRRDHERHSETQKTIGPTGIRTILADPRAERVSCLVFVLPWDFATYRHFRGPKKPDEINLVTFGDAQAAALVVADDPRIERVVFFADVEHAEQPFLSEMEQHAAAQVDTAAGAVFRRQHDLRIGVHGIIGLSEAYMQDASGVGRQFSPQGPQVDFTHGASMTMRLRPGPAPV